MVCKEVREGLSAYLEGALSPAERTHIEGHLKSCSQCSEELSDLSKTLEHLKNLETVEPPSWLTQKVMAKIKEEPVPKKGLLQRLFYPLHIKLPIEAVAAVLVIGLALYVYRDIAPEVKLAQAPVEEVTPQGPGQQPALREAEDKGVTPPVLPSDKVRSEEGLSLKRDKGGFAGKAAPAPERLAEKPASSKEPESMKDRFEATPKAPEPMKQAESIQGAEAPAPAKKIERVPATGAIAKGEARRETKAAVPEAKLSYMEKKKEEMLTLSVLVKDPEAAGKEIEKALKELEGKAVRVETEKGKKIITAILNPGKVHLLFEKLKLLGDVKEKEMELRAGGEDVSVRIEITKNSQRP